MSIIAGDSPLRTIWTDKTTTITIWPREVRQRHEYKFIQIFVADVALVSLVSLVAFVSVTALFNYLIFAQISGKLLG